MASGNGSNAENIMEYAAAYPHQLEVVGVITDQPHAGVIERAKRREVPYLICPYQVSKKKHEALILAQLAQWQTQWILLAGYFRILSAHFIQHFYNPELEMGTIVNIHPALLPAFPGKDGYGDAFAAGVKYSGVTLHFVDAGIDTGAIIAQEIFPRYQDDQFADFRQRGMEQEYRVYRRFLTALKDQQLVKTNNHFWIN